MKLFIPEKAFIDPKSQDYDVGRYAKEQLLKLNVPITNSKKVVIEGKSPTENYVKSKKTVYVTISRQKKLRPCSPSADYQFALSSSCPGHCEYCYLQTTQGEKPYMKIFVNIEDILETIQNHINENLPKITTFECASITDPIALEHLTGSLKRCIEFFANSEKGRLRLVTKFDNVDSLLNINHNKNTKFRFSINTDYIIRKFEHNTSGYNERIDAARKIANAGYPLGFIIAPIMIYENWKEDYRVLIENLKSQLINYKDLITFELIQHRFTATAKELIVKRFPKTELDLDEEKRQLKWGPYGKFKYVYPKDEATEIKEYMTELITVNFDNFEIEYFT